MASNDDATMADRLHERTEATARFVEVARRLVVVGDMQWDQVESDLRLLAINNSLRRQIEAIEASVVLARQDLGHLGVPFVRPALEDVMYLKFFVGLSKNDAQELFLALGVYDQLRSLIAQHDYIGNDEMLKLWYPQQFLDDAPANRAKQKVALKQLQKKHRWAGGDIPSGAWIAQQADEAALYDYLFAATSRAIHFSAGEIMRRGWGMPGGIMTTGKPEFRTHLAAFAMDQLIRLFLQTWVETAALHAHAGITNQEGSESGDALMDALRDVTALGRVPLLHAHEFNLTPDGLMHFKGA